MPAGRESIVLDGTHGEGGGALLRTALVMSALTEQPVRIVNVRAATRHPGLDPEDLTLIKALTESCAATVTGADANSTDFTFAPTRRARGLNGQIATYRNETGRGPNALVVLNSLIPVLARSGTYSDVSVEGETYGNNALSYDAFAQVTLPALRAMGVYAFPTLVNGGFGRESRGEVGLEIEPSVFTGLMWAERGAIKSVRAIVTTANLPRHVSDRGAAHLRNMARQTGVNLEVEKVEVDSATPGAYVTVWAEAEKGLGGGSAAGTRNLKIETLAQAAFEEALGWIESGAALDPYLADQLLIPCVISEGPSAFRVSRITQRLLTSIWVVKQFLPIHLTVRGSENHAGSISIQRPS